MHFGIVYQATLESPIYVRLRTKKVNIEDILGDNFSRILG